MQSNFSHKLTNYSSEELDQRISEIKHGLIANSSFLSGYSSQQLINIVDELAGFDLGKFLIINQGVNGYWTDYLINTPRDKISQLPELEQSIMLSSLITATYQRQQIFKRENQLKVSNGNHLASIPSGLMSELLDLDYSQIDNINITAIDLDLQAFEYSQQKYPGLYNKYNIQTMCCDALALDFTEQFDLISSNGLSIYIEDDKQVQQLFNNFYSALKPKGKLVTSFLTYPHSFSSKSEQLDIPASDKLGIAIFADILQVKWNSYRTTQQIKELVSNAGFTDIEVFGDQKYIFPTLIAYKL